MRGDLWSHREEFRENDRTHASAGREMKDGKTKKNNQKIDAGQSLRQRRSGGLVFGAGQGLFVRKTGYYFANFQRKEPGSLVYKLEPCDQYRDEYEKELTEQYRLAGWEAAGDVWRKFIIFAAVREMAVSPEISGEIRSAGDSSLKKTGHGCLMTCAADGVLTDSGPIWFLVCDHHGDTLPFLRPVDLSVWNKYLMENVRLHTDPEIFKGDKM